MRRSSEAQSLRSHVTLRLHMRAMQLLLRECQKGRLLRRAAH